MKNYDSDIPELVIRLDKFQIEKVKLLERKLNRVGIAAGAAIIMSIIALSAFAALASAFAALALAP